MSGGNCGRRILLVEDEPIVHRMLRGVLTLLGYEVVSAFRGLAAMKILERETVDLVILDKDLPDVSGTDVLLHLRRKNSGLPVIFMTGYRTEESVVLTNKLGVVAYLDKPFSSKDLEKSLRKAFSVEPPTRDP